MTYCKNCGKKLNEEALFCSKCGTRTAKGEEKNVSRSSDELRAAFAKMSQELEKAFSAAAKEINAAFKTASENVQKSLRKEQILCSSCGEKNPNNAVFCYNCGKRIKAKSD